MRQDFACGTCFPDITGTSSRHGMFPGSSAVEQPAVNRLVAGSNPARGAKFFQALSRNRFLPSFAGKFHLGYVWGYISANR